MGWKYVMIEGTFGKKDGTKIVFPVIFPDKMIHAEIAAVIKLCAPLDGRKQRVVSAGEICVLRVDAAIGRSKTLKLNSRLQDKDIINLYDYKHGIVGL